MHKSILLFDLDGTLTDPALGITNSFKYALKYYGLEIPSYEKLCSYIGPPLVDTFMKDYGFTKKQADEGVIKYREYFGTKGLFENEVYDGIPQMLQKLKDAGFHLFVATSKPEEYSIQIAEHFGFAKYFDKICGSNMDETRSKKSEVIEYALENAEKILSKKIDKSEVLMIGDRLHDIEGAKQVGIQSAGVLYGYGSEKELNEAGADFICPTVRILQDVLLSFSEV